MYPFRTAVEEGDLDAACALLHEDVVFRSPVVHTPYRGRAATEVILRTVLTVFEDFRYVDELAGAATHGLVFNARVGGRDLEGWDYIRTDEDGRIVEFTVMIRPLSGLVALADEMKRRLAG